MPNETNETLVEVRKAYRFLYQYQRKILDLMDFIGKSYGLNYNGGSCRFSSVSPRNGRGELNKWAWDWLNMYFYEFNFKNDKKPVFSVVLVNDTGSFVANKKDKTNSRTKISAFESVEISETKLVFYLCKDNWVDFWLNWEINDFVLEPTGVKINEKDNIFIYKSYLLENLDNEDKALKVLKDFENFCKINNVTFKVLENKFKK